MTVGGTLVYTPYYGGQGCGDRLIGLGGGGDSEGIGGGGGAHPCKSSRRSVVFIYLFIYFSRISMFSFSA